MNRFILTYMYIHTYVLHYTCMNAHTHLHIYTYTYVLHLYAYTLIQIHSHLNHHHHHVVLVARISLTLCRHLSLSFIASGRSSGLHPVSSHRCWMYVRAGCPAFARPCVGVHKSTSLMSSSLLLHTLIHIFTNLLSTSIHGYQEKRKITPPGTRDKNISNRRPGKKRKNIIGQKKRKGQLCHTSWKKSRGMQSVGQKKNKTHRKMPQCYNYKSAQYEVEPITKINLNCKLEYIFIYIYISMFCRRLQSIFSLGSLTEGIQVLLFSLCLGWGDEESAPC